MFLYQNIKKTESSVFEYGWKNIDSLQWTMILSQYWI
jgi:hypothetical protein